MPPTSHASCAPGIDLGRPGGKGRQLGVETFLGPEPLLGRDQEGEGPVGGGLIADADGRRLLGLGRRGFGREQPECQDGAEQEPNRPADAEVVRGHAAESGANARQGHLAPSGIAWRQEPPRAASAVDPVRIIR